MGREIPVHLLPKLANIVATFKFNYQEQEDTPISHVVALMNDIDPELYEVWEAIIPDSDGYFANIDK